ncbi:hypothetical protein [uncultured Shewanella sp.]|uniref:hypothetical protein n=1 Tax=uncultured Shewanella sp. TaxID=173975 RepID=UPI00262C23A4|nr:hypothetical protein [uncultured Shewanella sp.]
MNITQFLVVSESDLMSDFFVRSLRNVGFLGKKLPLRVLGSIVSNNKKHNIHSTLKVVDMVDNSVFLFDLDSKFDSVEKVREAKKIIESELSGGEVGYVMSVGQYDQISKSEDLCSWIESIQGKILFKPLNGLMLDRYISQNFMGHSI